MSKKLYVSNLAFSMNETSLQDLFTEFGTVVSAKIITDRLSGRSKGFGFVEMETEQQAANAISKLNGVEVNGRTIGVAEARPQQPRENRGGNGGGYGAPRQSRGYSDRY